MVLSGQPRPTAKMPEIAKQLWKQSWQAIFSARAMHLKPPFLNPYFMISTYFYLEFYCPIFQAKTHT
jgi:hypothetical protein